MKSKKPPSRNSKAYHCRRVQQAISIDGRLDEPGWADAEILACFKVPVSKKLAHFQTTTRLLWDDENLYFGAEMEDADIYGQHEGHDPPFGGDDVIELFIKPSREKPVYWEFHVTPRGATRDYFYARRGAGPDERWMVYDSGMRAAVTLDGTLNHWEDRDKGWTVELAIPWSAFEKTGGRPKAGDCWSFMAARYDYSVYLEEGLELSASCALPKVNFHLFEFYQDLLFVQ